MKKWSLSKWTLFVFALWIVAQVIIIVCFWNARPTSDANFYVGYAQECYKNGEWYPMQQHLYENFYWAPGHINFLILQLKLFGTINANSIFNLFMNIGIVYFIYYLSKRFFSLRTACFAVIIYCLILSNATIVAPKMTEIPYTFFALAAFCLCLSLKKRWLVVAGILFVIANSIRPMAIIFLLVALVFMFIKKCHWKQYIAVLLPVFALTFLIGYQTEKKIGHFAFQSSTGGINLILVANDKATGGWFPMRTDSTSTGYIKNIEKYTFVQRDSIWKHRAIEWIREHPVKYAEGYVKRIFLLYQNAPNVGLSSIGRGAAHGDGEIVNAHGVIVDSNGKKVSFKEPSLSEKIFNVFNGIARHFYCSIVLFIFVYSLIVNMKEILSTKGLLLLILFLGTAATCLFAVLPRYHFPLEFAIVIWAAYGIDTYLKKTKQL